MENWELTEYELERQPQEINMDSDMAISPRSLYREIVCPICLDILSQTRAAPDCLHRFCKKCIEKIVKKDCPVCGKKLPSQIKSFREDAKFDQLIKKISEGYEASKPLDINRSSVAPDCEIVLRHLNGRQTRYLKCPENTTVDHLTRYLAIRPEGSQGPKLENDEEYKLCIVANRSTGHYEQLSGTLKLEDIKNNYRLNTDQPLELYYYNP
uniref:RING-type E3 ubiquitin transferase n=1 Tax=Aceria tosichella TaxID=561515 RepID=A0A6G1SM93_9ACAR